MYHSVVKVLKNLGLEFFKIKLQSLIYNIVCQTSTSYAHAVRTSLLLASNDISKKVVIYYKQKHPGCKKSARPIRSSIANRYVQPKTLISVEAKKLRTYVSKIF